MSLTVRSKQELINRIIEAKIGIQMSEDILNQVKLFEHRKQVNKTFTDSFQELGYQSYICRDNHSSKFVVRKRVDDENHKGSPNTYVEISIYHSEIMEKRPFSWDEIRREVAKYDYAGRLVEAQEALRVSDDEIILFENFVNYVEQQEFKIVDLWRIKSDLKEALKNVKKNVAQ